MDPVPLAKLLLTLLIYFKLDNSYTLLVKASLINSRKSVLKSEAIFCHSKHRCNKNGGHALLSITNLPDLDARFKPLFQEVKRSMDASLVHPVAKDEKYLPTNVSLKLN